MASHHSGPERLVLLCEGREPARLGPKEPGGTERGHRAETVRDKRNEERRTPPPPRKGKKGGKGGKETDA